jgi:hypothetical protein
MRVLVLETNLMWTSRLKQSLIALGHEPTVTGMVPDLPFDVAIVNLGDEPLRIQVPQLHERGIYTIAHAGHKEKELHAIGKDLGCDRLATNSELTFKLPHLLDEFVAAKMRGCSATPTTEASGV